MRYGEPLNNVEQPRQRHRRRCADPIVIIRPTAQALYFCLAAWPFVVQTAGWWVSRSVSTANITPSAAVSGIPLSAYINRHHLLARMTKLAADDEPGMVVDGFLIRRELS